MPTKNMTFLWALIRLYGRKAVRRISPSIIVLILGAITAYGVADYTSLKSALEQFIEDQESKSIRTFDDVIDDLNRSKVTRLA